MIGKRFMQEEKKSLALSGLRVLELGGGVAVPYAGRLLSLLGADVLKLESAEGDPARDYPLDDEPLAGPSPLFLYLNAGKANVRATAARSERALSWADIVLDSRVRSELDQSLAGRLLGGGRPLYVSVTAWGFDADRSGEIDDELIVQAQSGVMTLTGNPDQAPLRFPGFQSQYLAGAFATAAVLTAVLGENAHPSHIDVAWVSAMTAGTEGSYQRYLYTRVVPPPAGPNPLAAFPAGAFRCADGYVVPGTVRQHDWEMQCLLYEKPELIHDERFATPASRRENYLELWDMIQPWYDSHSRVDIFSRALEVGWACGMVLDAQDALHDEHLLQRQFLRSAGQGDLTWRAPARLAIGLNSSSMTEVRLIGDDDDWFDTLEVEP